VVKSAADQELLSAIRAVVRGEVYIHPSLTRALLDELLPARDPHLQDPWQELSEREQQVIRQVALGHTNREIAQQLSLSVKTVETYRARAMEKLGLTGRAQLVEYAVGRGLLGDG
jgi:DNA-binding NarL/FixJ family response regulator